MRAKVSREGGESSGDIDETALEQARLAVESTLIEFRDARISVIGRGNGFVVREPNGDDSHIMRLSTKDGLRIGLKAYLAALRADDEAAK